MMQARPWRMLRGDAVALGDLGTEEFDPQGTAEAAPESDGIRLHASGWRLVKRMLDVMLSLTLILLTLPLMLLIALAITIESRGPVFFVHRRVGKGRAPFGLLKFRTMVPDAEERLEAYLAEHPEHLAEWRQYYKLRDDPRITRVGGFLRKSSLDELPQLFNILRGDMSVVGPRAIVRDEVPRFERYADTMLSVKPGLTGLWAVSGRSDVTQQHRAVLEYRYVTEWSLLLDLWILFRTIPAVIRGHGAY